MSTAYLKQINWPLNYCNMNILYRYLYDFLILEEPHFPIQAWKMKKVT